MLSAFGAGDIVSNAAAGAQYRFSLAWLLLLALVFRFVWLDASARYVLVTGESILQGLHRLGKGVTWIMFGVILVVRHALNLSKVLLIGEATQILLPLPFAGGEVFWSLAGTSAAFALVCWGGYPWVERLFKWLMAGLGASLAVAAVIHFPEPSSLWSGLFHPEIPASVGPFSATLIMLALIGTEAGSMTNLTYSYFLREKGWRDISRLSLQRRELAGSISCMFLLGIMLQITAAGVFSGSHESIRTTRDLVHLLGESQGTFGVLVFTLGLWAAVFTGFTGATTGYALMAVDAARNLLGCRWGQGKASPPGEAAARRDPLYRILVGLWILAPAYILLVDAEPLHLLLATHAAAATLIPLLACGLLYLINQHRLAGKFRHRWVPNVVLILIIMGSIGMGLAELYRWGLAATFGRP
jgi:Mn2+/Fe2+ NRAMP family transporter